MSALRQAGPYVVGGYKPTANSISARKLAHLSNDSTLLAYMVEQPSISSHLSLGDTGYHIFQRHYRRLGLDGVDALYKMPEDCDCCLSDEARSMSEELMAL